MVSTAGSGPQPQHPPEPAGSRARLMVRSSPRMPGWSERFIAQNKYEIGSDSAVLAIGKWPRTRQDHRVFIVV